MRSLKTEAGKQLQKERQEARWKSWPDARAVRGERKAKLPTADEQAGAWERDGSTWLERLSTR